MVSSISSNLPTLAVPTRPPKNDPFAAKQITGADRALHALLNDPGMLDALASNSSTFLPATFNQVLSYLWGAMDANGDGNVTRRELEHATILAGGSTSDADALWSRLHTSDPFSTSGANLLSAGKFASNAYLGLAIVNNLPAEQAAVNQKNIQNQAQDTSNSNVLLYMFGGSSTDNSSAGNAVNIFA